MNRRKFLNRLREVAIVAGGTALLPKWLNAQTLISEEGNLHKLTILHTNDVHSRIEPFPMDGSKQQGLGGAARRAAILDEIRKTEENVLLLDAGDMFQGTPYFNYFKGELEVKLMSQMRYDAATIGNHDFDAGLDNLQHQIQQHAKFDLINCNYDFADTIMNGHAHPYKIYKKGNLKIGVLGVGVELEGLVPSALTGKTRYLSPVEQANKYAAILKNDYRCDYIICLSHLGYSSKTDKIADLTFAPETTDIDLIIGGHSHTFLDAPTVAKNKKGEEVLITQAGWAGLLLGRIDVYFERSRKTTCVQCKNTVVQ